MNKVYLIHRRDRFLLGSVCDISNREDNDSMGGQGFSFAAAIADMVNLILDSPIGNGTAEFTIEIR